MYVYICRYIYIYTYMYMYTYLHIYKFMSLSVVCVSVQQQCVPAVHACHKAGLFDVSLLLQCVEVRCCALQ